jgi:hypothetical protein
LENVYVKRKSSDLSDVVEILSFVASYGNGGFPDILGVSLVPYSTNSIFNDAEDGPYFNHTGNPEASKMPSDIAQRVTVFIRTDNNNADIDGVEYATNVGAYTQYLRKDPLDSTRTDFNGCFPFPVVQTGPDGATERFVINSLSTPAGEASFPTREHKKTMGVDVNSVSLNKFGMSFVPLFPRQFVWVAENNGHFRDGLVIRHLKESDARKLFPVDLFSPSNVFSSVRASSDWRRMTRYSASALDSTVKIIEASYMRTVDALHFGSADFYADVGCTIYNVHTRLIPAMILGNFAFGKSLNNGKPHIPTQNVIDFGINFAIGARAENDISRFAVVALPIRNMGEIEDQNYELVFEPTYSGTTLFKPK